MEMLHYLQTMHYLPKVFIVNVLFQRKGNNFRNENSQLVPVNSLKSTLQWHLEGKTLKINKQNVHFKSMLKKQEAQDYLDGQLPGLLEQLVTVWGFMASLLMNSFLSSCPTSQLLLYTSRISTVSLALPFFFFSRGDTSISWFSESVLDQHLVLTLFLQLKMILHKKNVVFFRRGHFLFLVE